MKVGYCWGFLSNCLFRQSAGVDAKVDPGFVTVGWEIDAPDRA